MQVARGSVPGAAWRERTGGRTDDLASYVVSKVGLGMLDLVRVGFSARTATDPISFRAAVDAFATREARAARGGVTAFLGALGSSANVREDLPKRLWAAVEGAAAVVSGAKGRDPGLDEVLDKLGIAETDFERAAGGVGPVCPVAVDPFSYKVVVRSVFMKDALEAAAEDRQRMAEDKGIREDVLPFTNPA